MRYLEEDVLQDVDRIKLALNLPELIDKCEKLKAGPVRVWNQGPSKPGVPVQTPTRALRLFLPPEEGGVDKSIRQEGGAEKRNRLQSFYSQSAPWPAFVQGLEEEGLSPARLDIQAAQEQLQVLCIQLWQNYAVVPTQQLLRGRLDDCTKRLVRIQSALKDLEGQNPEEMQDQIATWIKRAKQA